MLTNVIIGMLIPWIFCIFLFIKASKIVILMFPLGISIAFMANDWGYNLFWVVTPTHENPSLSAMPFSIGYFPLLTCAFTYIKIRYNVGSIFLIVLFTITTTSFEFFAVSIGKVNYYGGWNIGFTFLIYLAGFIVCALYMKVLYRYRIFVK
ncbi:hypothetical protein [Pontibacillus sp. HMF3514]|uniref:hypothetical protein n=1 Tax=Pontibacillus sp. HMF3514 TaxID=2692425 RepID=UPI0013204F6F|nr:hypothetical protein [Pontibacillus sp. HMF3514]QHE50740.1 hypothetical protein GS400_01115 [Pontibacillus sp. HMF3514]